MYWEVESDWIHGQWINLFDEKNFRLENIQAVASYYFLYISRSTANVSKCWGRKKLLKVQFYEEKQV